MKRRLPAKRVYLSELQTGYYVEKEGDFDPNYILTKNGEKIHRAKIVATIVSGPYFSDDNSYARILLDDTTATMWGSAFRERAQLIKPLERGMLVQLIAKPREWQDNKQLTIEAVTSVSPEFLLLARAETVARVLNFKKTASRARELMETTGAMRKALELASKENIAPEVLEGIDELDYLLEKERDESVNIQNLEVVKKQIIEKIMSLQSDEKGVELDVLIAELDSEFTTAEIEEALKSLLSLGDVFEPSIGHYMLA